MKIKIKTVIVLKWALVSLFVIAYFLYVYFGIHSELIFHKQQPPFQTNFQFFSLYLSYPGGITDYVATFLSQFFSTGWAGSFIISITAIVIVIQFFYITKSFNRLSGNFLIITLPIALMVTLFGNYDFPFSIILQFILLNLSLFLFLRSGKQYSYSIITYIAVSIILYYLAGSGEFMIFSLGSLLIVFHKNGFKNGIIRVIPIILFTLIFPIISFNFIFNVDFKSAFFQITSENQTYLQYKPFILFYLFYWCTPISLIFLILSDMLPSKKIGTDSLRNQKKKIAIQNKNNNNAEKIKFEPLFEKDVLLTKQCYQLILQLIILTILSVFLICFSSDKHQKNIVMADYYCYTEQWDKAIEVALNDKEYDLLLNFYYNRAICGTGKFAELFFNYPQYAGADVLFPDKQMAFEVMMLSCDYYFDLGYIAESSHYAYEIQTFQPYNPRVLKRLVICNLISGNYKEADKFLSVLGDNILSHDFVQKYRTYINDPLLIANDKFLAEKRRFMPINKVIPYGIENKLIDLTRQNMLNTNAFEHLAMVYLLDHKFEKFMSLLPNLSFLYKELPSVFEEAIIIYCVENKNENISQFKLKSTTEKDFTAMLQTLQQKGKKDAQSELKKNYNSKYYYYLLYNSPLVTNAKLKSKQEIENDYQEN